MRRFGVLCFLVSAACGAAPPPPPVPSDPIVVPPSASADAGPPPAATAPNPGSTPAFDALVRALSGADGWDARRVTLASYREEGGAIRIEVRARSTSDVAEVAKRLQASRAFVRLTLGPADRAADGGASAEITAAAHERAADLVLTSGADAAPLLAAGARNPFDPMTTAPDPPGALDADIDKVRLVGIVAGAEKRALFLGPSDVGWIGKVGDLVGTSACRYRIHVIGAVEVTLEKVDPAACPDRVGVRKMLVRK